jgi:hypothetical protein
MAEQRRHRIHTQRQHLAFDRPHRRSCRRRQAGDLARPRTRREQHRIGIDASVLKRDTGNAARIAFDRRDLRMLVQRAAGSDKRRAQGAYQPAVLDLMIAGAIDRSGKIGMEVRLFLPCWRWKS